MEFPAARCALLCWGLLVCFALVELDIGLFWVLEGFFFATPRDGVFELFFRYAVCPAALEDRFLRATLAVLFACRVALVEERLTFTCDPDVFGVREPDLELFARLAFAPLALIFLFERSGIALPRFFSLSLLQSPPCINRVIRGGEYIHHDASVNHPYAPANRLCVETGQPRDVA